jgi:hypothetical protein
VTATQLTGELQTGAQPNITSVGNLGALTVDDVAIDGKVITMTGDTSDTATITAGTNGTLAITTTDAAGANGNITITADGTFEAVGTTITLDSGAGINLETDALSIGNNGDTDVAVTFQGNTSDGVITWMEDEDEFKFSDDILMDSTKKIQFGDTASFIHQSADGTLTIDGEAIIDLNASTRVDVSGDIKVGGEVQTAKIAFTDGDDAITIADGGGITANTSLTLASGSTVTAIQNQNDMAANSTSALATQASIKAYVDSVAGAANNVTGLSASGAELNTVAHPSTIASNIGNITLASQDAVLVYDDSASVPRYVYIDYIDAYGASTTRTLTNKTLTSPIVTGLHLNDSGFTVEGSSADSNDTTVTFTNPTANRTITFPDNSGTVPLLDSNLDLSFADNDKAIFGAGSDLQIYSNGSKAIIETNHTTLGNGLRIQNTNDGSLGATLDLAHKTNSVGGADFNQNINFNVIDGSNSDAVGQSAIWITNANGFEGDVKQQFYVRDSNGVVEYLRFDGVDEQVTSYKPFDANGGLEIGGTLVTATAAELNKLDGVTATTAKLNYIDVTTLGLTEASKAVTADANGVVSFDNGTIEEVTSVSSSSNAATINLRDGNVFEHDLTENVTYTFSNPAANGRGSAFILKVIQDSSARSITWPGSVDWAGGTAPTLTTTNNGVDVFGFFTIDGGTTYYGFTLGQAMG